MNRSLCTVGRRLGARFYGIKRGAGPVAANPFPKPSFRHVHSQSTRRFTQSQVYGVFAGVVGAGAIAGSYLYQSTQCKAKPAKPEAGEKIDGLPFYSKEDVLNHNSKDKRIWVTFKNGVYDITEFVEGHPGGDKILLASGGPLEPFWALYAAHRTPEVLEMLEEMRIGNIDVVEHHVDSNDPYANDPIRHPALRVNTKTPFNAETPPELLLDNFITPNELFFVRNHLPVPEVDGKNFRVSIEVEGGKKISFSIDELKRKFKEHTVMATLQCAGNRREEMSAVKHVKGLMWKTTAISNATWTGVKLSDVLHYAGLKEDNPRIAHVQFEGLDKDPEGSPYGASIPVEKAMDPYGEVLLAYKMNGQDIPRDHGYPLRAVIPGVVGARNVKWCNRVLASAHESPSHWQQNDYKSFCPSITWDDVDFSKSVAVQNVPVQSVIISPANGAIVDREDGVVTMKGYAWSGGGQGIVRVDVSIDGGKTWQATDLVHPDQRPTRTWAWSFWEATIDIPKNHRGDLKLVCKAIDTSHNTQPDSVQGIWNLRGLLNNSWHHVRVKMV